MAMPIERRPESESGDPDVPVEDFLADIDLDQPGGVEEAMDELIGVIESGYYLRWEAVVRQEQGLELSEIHEESLEDLLSFRDEEDEDAEDDERILYIDEVPRPSEPWFETARKIVPRLLMEPFSAHIIKFEVVSTGWPRLVETLEEHGRGLSLPEGVSSPIDVFPTDLQHRLWLQTCFDALDGLGQDERLTLEREDEQERVDEFIVHLQAHKDSVSYFGLTLGGLLERIEMPRKDKEILTRMMMDRLALPSSDVPFAQML